MIIQDGCSRGDAEARFYLLDKHGLIKRSLGDKIREEIDGGFVRGDDEEWGTDETGLEEVVQRVRPTVLIGTSTHAGAFNVSSERRARVYNLIGWHRKRSSRKWRSTSTGRSSSRWVSLHFCGVARAADATVNSSATRPSCANASVSRSGSWPDIQRAEAPTRSSGPKTPMNGQVARRSSPPGRRLTRCRCPTRIRSIRGFSWDASERTCTHGPPPHPRSVAECNNVCLSLPSAPVSG